MTHPLDTYLNDAGETRSDFAKQLGVSRQYVSNLINGHTGATLKKAFAIQEATKGKVLAADILAFEERHP